MAHRGAVLVFVLAFAAAARAATPSARSAIALPVPAATIAETLSISPIDRSRILLYAIRVMFDPSEASPATAGGAAPRVAALLRTPTREKHEAVPLPLTPRIWRDAIFSVPIEENDVLAAIIEDRSAALMYYGLSAMDDETLQWLAQRRDVLVHLTRHAGAFAAFGRSVRIASGRVVVPGGNATEPIWREVAGATPAEPAAFIKGLFRNDRGRLAFFYDTIAHLDAPRQRFALQNLDRARALASVFDGFARDWDVEARPFSRPQLDPMLLLDTVRVSADGVLAEPADEAFWSRVFRDDLSQDVEFRDAEPWKTQAETERVDAAWLASKIHLVPYHIGRRRLDTFLFTQRAFANGGVAPHLMASVARAFVAMPALMLTLERMQMDPAAVMLPAARHARALSTIGSEARDAAVPLFQSALGFVERGRRSRALSHEQARDLVLSLSALRVDEGQGYDRRIAEWLRTALFRVSPQPPLEATDPVEAAVLALMAGAREGRVSPIVEWEGQRYRLDHAGAELGRLQHVREQQGGGTLDAAIARLQAAKPGSAEYQGAQRALVDAAVSTLYAAHIGAPDSAALAAGNVALKHDFGGGTMRPGQQTLSPWKLPGERFGRAGGRGWHVQGSLLALDVALRRLALRRLDSARLPAGPKVPLLDRQVATMTIGLLNPYAIAEEDGDRIAGALARGHQRVEALKADASLVDAVATEAGLGEWRRESLRWTLAHAPDEAASYFAPLELFWLGAGGSVEEFHTWGGPALPSTGCLCLDMPRPSPFETFAGRPTSGLLASRAVDPQLKIVSELSRLKLPASLTPAVLAFALQDVLDDALPAYLDDWHAFGAAANALSSERIVDYIAALTAGGPLVPVSTSVAERH